MFSSQPNGQPQRHALTTSLIAMTILMLAGSGCSRLPVVGKSFEKQKQPNGQIEMELRLVRTNLRPGDPVLAYGWIRNMGHKTLSVQMLDASSVEFYVASPGPAGTVRVLPVVSPKEPLGQVEEIGPRQVLPKTQARTFVFTTLTKEPGNFRLQAIYHPTVKGKPSDLPPVIAKAVAFQVGGQRSCNRDRDGVLLKDDAVGIAKRHVGRPATVSDALLFEDEMGFLVWKVIFTIDPKDLKPGEENPRAVLVNPYLAVIVPPRTSQPSEAPKAIKNGRPERPKILPSPTKE